VGHIPEVAHRSLPLFGDGNGLLVMGTADYRSSALRAERISTFQSSTPWVRAVDGQYAIAREGGRPSCGSNPKGEACPHRSARARRTRMCARTHDTFTISKGLEMFVPPPTNVIAASLTMEER